MPENFFNGLLRDSIAFNLSSYAPLILFFGVVMYLFIKKSMVKYIGEIIMGFGMLFVGIATMKLAIAPLSQSKEFINFISNLDNPALNTIIHLAVFLSAITKKNPQLAYQINLTGLHNMLELSREQKYSLFVPSSIAAFGPSTPADKTPQDTIQRPTSMYGVTKVAGELLCDYYH